MASKTSNPAAWRADGARKSTCLAAVGSEIIKSASHFQQIFVTTFAEIDPAALAFLLMGETAR